MTDNTIYPASKKQIELLKQGLENGYISESEYKKALVNSMYAYAVIGIAMENKRISDSVKLINACTKEVYNYDGRVYDHNEVVNIGIWDNYEIPICCSDDM